HRERRVGRPEVPDVAPRRHEDGEGEEGFVDRAPDGHDLLAAAHAGAAERVGGQHGVARTNGKCVCHSGRKYTPGPSGPEADRQASGSSGAISSSSRVAVSGSRRSIRGGIRATPATRQVIAAPWLPVRRNTRPSAQRPSAAPSVAMAARAPDAVERYEVGKSSLPRALNRTSR